MLRRWVLPAIAVIVAAAIAASVVCFMPVSRDGTSVRRAIILQVPEEQQGFEEWSWIEEHHPDWNPWFHSIEGQKGWLYSRYLAKTPAGEKEVYFDLRKREPTPSAADAPSLADDTTHQDKLEAEAWKRLIDYHASRQLAGKKPPYGESWNEYWTSYYSFLRHNTRGLPWKGSDFKTTEDLVIFIKEKLRAHGLPTYE